MSQDLRFYEDVVHPSAEAAAHQFLAAVRSQLSAELD
jgi:hypothetical protein